MGVQEAIPIVAIVFGCGVAAIAIISKTILQVARMRQGNAGAASESIRQELEALRRQMAELRETTTNYDLSFDAALQRMESRTGAMEERLRQLEQQQILNRTGAG